MDNHQLYTSELTNAMTWLSQQEKTVFLGQTVKYPGTALFESFRFVPNDMKIEFPVTENFQVAYSIGLALGGYVPVSVFPRWNFLVCAADQLVNHLDKLPSMSLGEYNPRVIIRVAVGSEIPIDPQDQHKGNFANAFRELFKHVDIIELYKPEDILPAYQLAYNRTDNKSTILVEFSDYGKS
jgi:pyruvate/2-oxoglutarate/acetoin dehydrogenase E1 component